MSFDIVKTIRFPQVAFQYVPQEILEENAFEEFPILGGILSDLKHLWHVKGPCLEVRNIVSGRKVGSWTFGGILKDSNTKIITVDELKRPNGRLPLLVVALDCTISGGLVCVFDIFGSKVLRVIQVREQITSLHVVDSGCENSVLPEPSPLRYFDGIVAIGTLGGNVYLLDICRQICEKGINDLDSTTRDELNPCPMIILHKEKIVNIKKYVERSVHREEHLAIHLNVVLNPSTEHFELKGEHGEDRVHVNRLEAEVSSLFYSPQIASLLVGYNFGAFQLWDLRSLELIYTSPICEEHIPVMHFTVQEPADDPKAYCYIWVSYSHNLKFHSGFPFAVMYSFYYNNKNYINGYGSLYEDFQHCSIRFQIELGNTETSKYKSRVKGGTCIGLQSLNKYPVNKDFNSLSLCLISWLMWNSNKEVNTSVLVFDLNQWYKEQMPSEPNWLNSSNYIIKQSLNQPVLDVKLDQKTLSQFIGIQRLEEHFCPTSLSFDLWCVTENGMLKVHKKGTQQAFIDKLVEDQHLSLVRPEEYFEQVITLGLAPLFCEIHLSSSLDIDYQREILLNVALEQKLVGWLCKCTSKLANDAFNANGLTIYNILNWAFERAITLKNSCDKYCVCLFDYSGTKLDSNTVALLNCSIGQIRNICSLYKYVATKLMQFISDKGALLEEQRSLENVVVYFEVLLWMVNIGLLPECQVKNYRSYDDSLMSAPYLVNDLTQYYDRKRAQLQMVSHDTFVEKDCLLFVDNLINNRGGAEILRQQWQEDGGSGLYPPPSLQSILRIYFLDGPDLIFKHSLVTYTLLDIAMTVDENNKIIKLLLKFPQIFDLSQSNIKIVQAFWHLDHDDYETALQYILDPCVLTEDLHHWHHSVMMRSLLLQDQSSLALLYLQIRKPSIQDEKDLLTVLSLLISKNMLDEAFKFRQQHQNPNEQALLLHIFNECNKNELLHTLLYRRLDSDEEKAFFKYLQSTKNPRCEDLKVFYYLLRSRFLEAFDSYAGIKRKKPENQGLIGQRDATTADNIVKMFKSLLPDVNRNLVDLVRKERTTLWREVKKPTPLSVFVHNAKDQVQYKSSVIFAALAKAKQTFNDTLNDTKNYNDVVTEEMPFLRTPTVFREVSSLGTPLVRSKVIEQNERGEEYGPSPCKKLRLSPRTSKTSPLKPRNLSISTIQSKLSTPIIKRKKPDVEAAGNSTTTFPQSILKGSSASRTILDDSIFDENTSANTSLQLECENSIRRSRLGLTSRKPVGRTPLKSHVKFDDLRYSGSSNEQNSKNDSTLNQLRPEETSRSQSVNSTTSTADEIFYSPDSSPDKEMFAEANDDKMKTSLSPVKEKLSFDDTVTGNDVFIESNKESETPKVPVGDNDLSTNRLTFQSPKSRRSYKRSFGESPTPVRSSPRLAKKASAEEKEDSIASESIINQSNSLIKPSSSVAVQKVRGRKSLSRAVLENNIFSKLRSSNLFEERKSLGNKSNVSSVNTTFNDTGNSEVSSEPSRDDSLEEYLRQYKNFASSDDSFVNKSNSFAFNTDKNNVASTEEVVSKITEVQSVETHRESLRRAHTQEIVSSKETREEHYSKKVEIFEQDQEVQQKEPIDISVFNEETQEFTEKNSDINEGLVGSDEEHKDENQDINIFEEKTQDFIEQNLKMTKDLTADDRKYETTEIQNTNESINVYEDLSSGSDDIKEVLKQFKKTEDDSKVYADVSFASSSSYYQTEGKQSQIYEDVMEIGKNSIDNVQKSPQPEQVYDNDVDMDEVYADMDEVYADIPITEQAFVDTEGVIEINSSSEEEDRKKDAEQDTDESSSSSSSNESKSHSFKDESDPLNVGFEYNLGEITDEEEKVNGKRSADSDQNVDQDEVFEEVGVVLVQGENIGDDEHIEENSNENLIPEEQDEIEIAPDDSSLNDDVSNDLERQFEADQKEIEDALKMIQKQDSVIEEQVEANDEHMDSLILEDQTPEKQAVEEHLEPKIVPLSGELNMAGNDVQQAVQQDRISEEKEHTLKKVKEDHQEQKNEELSDISEAQKVIKSDEIAEKDHVPVEIMKKNESGFKSVNTSEGGIFVKESDVPEPWSGVRQPDTNQTMAGERESEDIITEKQGSTSPLKESKSVQCTIGAGETLMETTSGDYTSVFLKDDGNKSTDLVGRAVDQTSKGLQCTIASHNTDLESSENDDPAVSRMEVSKIEEQSVHLVLKTVTKTYSTKESPSAGPSKIQSRRSSRGTSTKIEPSTSKKLFAHNITGIQPKKRTRSASVDQPASQIDRKKSTRSKTVDLDDIQASNSEFKKDLRVLLAPIQGRAGPSTEKDVSDDEGSKHDDKAYSDVGAYTTSRRLTRRQASMLKSIGTLEKNRKRLPSVDEIDPLELLDKSEFRGKPDPGEAKVFDQISPSTSSGTPSRHTRSASVVSDTPSTPKRLSKVKADAVNSPVSGIKTRLRRQSTDTMSVASEQSDSPSPPKRSKKKNAENEADTDGQSVGSTKKGRSRINSVSSTKSAGSDQADTSARATRGRRLTSTRSELPKIQEEKNNEEGEVTDTSTVKKRGRKKKD